MATSGNAAGRADFVVDSQVSGNVTGAVVQSGAIHGGVHIQQAARREIVPRQLPPAAAHFTNRSAELTVLDQISDNKANRRGMPGLALLTGPGGIGKTALAVSWAASQVEQFPDGQLYADLRGFSPNSAVSTEQVLGAFLRGLGIAPEWVPVELAEQVALFRSLTAGRKLLVLVDNALSAAQVRPLLPASEQSMAVVTSRLRLGGLHAEGAVFVDLEPLPHEHAVELLARSLGEDRVVGQLAQVGQLASLCGQLPIALRVAGARLASRPRWAVARVVAELADERHRLVKLSAGEDMSVGAAFELSYHALSDDQARLFRLVSLHPGPDFGNGVAAAAAEVPEDEAENGLQALVDSSLLDELDDGRYRFHDLVRLHGRGQAERNGDEADAAPRRIAEWFLHQATRANMVVIPIRWRVSTVCERYRGTPPSFDSGGAAVRWLDTQLPNLLAVLEDAVARGWDELAWQVCEALWELFLHRKHYRHWITSHQLGIAAAQRCGNTVAESRLRCQLARAYLDLHRFDAAERECRLAEELARRAGSRHNESVAIDQLGMAAQGRGDIDTAVACFERSLLIERELGIDRGVAQRHRRIGEALLQADRDQDAAERLERARTMYAALSDTKDEAKVLVALARIDTRAGNPDSATRKLTAALAVLRASGSAVYHADALVAFSETAEHQGDLIAARRYLAEALVLSYQVGGPLVEQIQARLASVQT